jgi:hypothetical protein
MTESTYHVVQFIHPGFEYPLATQASGVMPWKDGRAIHNRKFLLSSGSYVDANGRDNQLVPIVFWGEWEGPSVHWPVPSHGKPLASVIHAPFRPQRWPERSVQNTDPMVFGDGFIYSNCMQPAFRSLRSLSPGSIVLFGRYGRDSRGHSFGLDTCLVIESRESMLPGGEGWGEDILSDAVLRPLASEGAAEQFTVYTGRIGPTEPFSFVPALPVPAQPPLFARPLLSPVGALAGIVSPAKNRGIKVARGVSRGQRDAIWREVVGQVVEQGCVLGYHLSPPPLLSESQARAAASEAVAPLEP